MQDIESPKLAKVNKRSERFLKDGTDILAIFQSLHFAVYESPEEPFQTLAKLQGYSLYSKREKKMIHQTTDQFLYSQQFLRSLKR